MSIFDEPNIPGLRVQHLYTSVPEMHRVISSVGRVLWTDDEDDDEQVLLEVIEDATTTMDSYLYRLHDAEDLKKSVWVRRRATVMACHYLTQRRGDPGLFSDRMFSIQEELQAVLEGLIQIPDMPFTAGMMAVMQNVTVDQRYLSQKNRVKPTLSTDTGGREPLFRGLPYEWL
jgi:phage gp36-like protein